MLLPWTECGRWLARAFVSFGCFALRAHCVNWSFRCLEFSSLRFFARIGLFFIIFCNDTPSTFICLELFLERTFLSSATAVGNRDFFGPRA